MPCGLKLARQCQGRDIKLRNDEQEISRDMGVRSELEQCIQRP